MEQDGYFPRYFAPVVTVSLVLLVLCVTASLVFGARALTLQEVMEGFMQHDSESYAANNTFRLLWRARC